MQSDLTSVGAIVGTFICGIMSAVMGSKRAMTFVAYPAIAFWLLVYFGDSIYYIYLARFATGLTGETFYHILLAKSANGLFQVEVCSQALFFTFPKYPMTSKYCTDY